MISEHRLARRLQRGHPELHKLTVIMTDGSRFETLSTCGKPADGKNKSNRKNDVVKLEVDRHTHSAWTGIHRTSATGMAAKFENRYKMLNKTNTNSTT